MMWIPLRSAKMYGRILGFQRRVWWPKWTPASSSSRIETTDTAMSSLRLGVRYSRRRERVHRPEPAPPPVRLAGTRERNPPNPSDDAEAAAEKRPGGARIPMKGDFALQVS